MEIEKGELRCDLARLQFPYWPGDPLCLLVKSEFAPPLSLNTASTSKSSSRNISVWPSDKSMKSNLSGDNAERAGMGKKEPTAAYR